jgi:hypothetical protein
MGITRWFWFVWCRSDPVLAADPSHEFLQFSAKSGREKGPNAAFFSVRGRIVNLRNALTSF